LSARVNFRRDNEPRQDSDLPAFRHNQFRDSWNAYISETHLFSPTLVNEFRAGYSRDYSPIEGAHKGAELVERWGLQGLNLANKRDISGTPYVNWVNFSGYYELTSYHWAQETYEFLDNLTWTKGRHVIKAGGLLRRYRTNAGGQDGRGPAIHIAELQDDLHTRPSRFTLPVHSPYPIVGGRLWCTLVKEGASDLDQAAIFFGEPGWESGDLYTFRWGKGSKKVEMDLDSSILREGVTHSYSIGFNMRGAAASDLSTQAGVDQFRLVTDLQVSPHSLPALALGKNTVRFRHQSPGAVKVRITHRWREVNGQHPPGVVEAAIAPADGGAASNLTPTLKWRPATDPDPEDKVVDYQMMVSLRPDCRWPLSPTLHQNVGSEKTEWKTPATFLNPETAYYWKVRARDSHGNIGQWSRVFHFKTGRFKTMAQPK